MFSISSTNIRAAAKVGADLSTLVPEVIIDDVKRIYGA
jgi:phosphopantetheine adenylyltransferase